MTNISHKYVDIGAGTPVGDLKIMACIAHGETEDYGDEHHFACAYSFKLNTIAVFPACAYAGETTVIRDINEMVSRLLDRSEWGTPFWARTAAELAIETHLGWASIASELVA